MDMGPTVSFDPQELRERFNPQGSRLWCMQQRMLYLLQQIDGICERHHISYWLSGGSMLGAVRHGGFIPWDDDLDIELPRTDFLRLMKILERELPGDMALQWHTTDANYFFQFAKVRDRDSWLCERNGYDRVWKEHGIFIDIFPVERVPRWIHDLSNRTLGHAYKMMRTARDPRSVMWKVRLLARLNRGVVFPVLRWLSRWCFPTPYYDFALGIPYFQHSLLEDFLPTRRVAFEDTTAPIMREAEKCLEWRYGNYMELPASPGSEYHAEDVEVFPKGVRSEK